MASVAMALHPGAYAGEGALERGGRPCPLPGVSCESRGAFPGLLGQSFDGVCDVLNSGAGALIGLAASLVLSRGRTARWAITFFGAGTGVGMAVERSSAEMSAAEREK